MESPTSMTGSMNRTIQRTTRYVIIISCCRPCSNDNWLHFCTNIRRFTASFLYLYHCPGIPSHHLNGIAHLCFVDSTPNICNGN